MQHKYFKRKDGLELPAYDAALTEWLENQPDHPPAVPYKILVLNKNVFYRALTCDGLGEYVGACEFLRSMNLVDASDYGFGLPDYESVFVCQDFINQQMAGAR